MVFTQSSITECDTVSRMSRRIQSRQVDAFRAIMVTGSVSSAASYMHVTQPAVSRLLRDLEYELGFPLFDRAGGRLAAGHGGGGVADAGLGLADAIAAYLRQR